jgi:hypothetical protein
MEYEDLITFCFSALQNMCSAPQCNLVLSFVMCCYLSVTEHRTLPVITTPQNKQFGGGSFNAKGGFHLTFLHHSQPTDTDRHFQERDSTRA